MTGMSRKEIARLLDHVEPQGVTLTRTTKGVMLRMPDGKSTAMLHFTGSDVRERDNVRSRLKRAGITWPGEGEPLGPRITDHKPTAHTLAQAEAALAKWDQRYINASQLVRLAGGQPDHKKLQPGEKAGMGVLSAQRALYHLGWIPTGKSTNRKWLRPLELEPEPEWSEPEQPEAELEAERPLELQAAIEAAADLVAGAVKGGNPVVQLHPAAEPEAEPEALHPAARAVPAERVHLAPQPEVKQHPAGHEFIDTVDSWTGNLDALPEGMSLAQLRALLSAFGLQLELRVWRAAE